MTPPAATPRECGDSEEAMIPTCRSAAEPTRKRLHEDNLSDTEILEKERKAREKEELMKPFTSPLVWKNVITFVILHTLAVIGFLRCITFYNSVFTWIWSFFIGWASAEGVLIGAHRLYSHKAFKAAWPLRLLVVFWQTVAGQNCMYIWVRDHRLHHKFSDTNADPHNARRGFWYSHVGWLNMKKHPLVIEKGRQIDLSDLERDPIVMFQKRWYKTLYVLCALVLPVYVPCALWNENWLDSLLTAYFVRYVIVLNLTWTVNSAAHLWGVKPYDGDIMPAENPYVGVWGFGEGWHNYHHAFPWDYRAAEFGVHNSPTTQMIDYFHKIGWASDLKSASQEMVKRRIERTGDGTHEEYCDYYNPQPHSHVEEAEPDPEETPATTPDVTPSDNIETARQRA